MKNIAILFLLSVLFIGCSGNTEPVGSSQTFLEKYHNTFWKNQSANPVDFDYYGFKNEEFFLQIVYIETANNNEMICGKLRKGSNPDQGTNYDVQITKNTDNELWLNINYVGGNEIFKFSINTSGNQMVLLHLVDNQLYTQETFALTNLNYDFFCSTTTAAVPVAPTGLTGSLTGTQATLNWTDNSTNETGFKIERKTGTGNFSQISSVGANVSNYVDNGLLSNTSYTYRVISYNTAGNSLAYSNEFTINTTPSVQSNLVFKWNLDKWLLNNVNQTLSICDKQHYIQFNSNGTFERKDYFLNGTTCQLEGADNGTYTYNTTTNKITLNFTDPVDGAQIETLNNVIITSTTLKYSWDEDKNGTDEHQMEFIK